MFYTCVCYLPPNNSSRQVDVSEFFDSLLCNIYTFQNLGPLFICGDFNSRIGDNVDFISGVDDVIDRNVVDFSTNMYGDKLLTFLIDSNMCVLNGRNYTHNDFTSISVKGSSVVDYCIVHQDNLELFSDFNVITVTRDRGFYVFFKNGNNFIINIRIIRIRFCRYFRRFNRTNFRIFR